MPLSWNEIKSRAMAFSREWADETSEDAEAKSFWDSFFEVFGISRRRVASFEMPVTKDDGRGGFIDLLWKGVLLVEHKSRGRDLDRAEKQALEYFPGLKERDLPRYVLVSDFERFRLHDLDEDKHSDFLLADLHKHVNLFSFVAGYQTQSYGESDPVNIKAAEKLGILHDQLKDCGYTGHELEVLLVRLLFCLFADDTGIFPEAGQLRSYIDQRTHEDGSDLGMHLTQLFQVLNTAENKRQKKLDEDLAAFPYVNGKLFAEPLSIASFDSKMREALLECAALDWSRISPAIFGSLFQSIMDKTARRNLGAHYTSETNILKALRPLFLDALRAEFETLRNKPKRLLEFHQRLGQIHVFDPACGCGNFLVIAYRELRLLELDVLREMHKNETSLVLNITDMVYLNVDRFYGIEIEEFPAQIAQVALWLTDHQMNLRVSEEFGQYFARLPLKTAPHIVHGNALTLDWTQVVAPEKLSYIVGNPPFIGKNHQNAEQRADVDRIFHSVKKAKLLDYVTCWYRKAVDYMQANPVIRAALVSTNSITQGEQISILWSDLLQRGVHIHFAHRTFQWNSEARGKATVHCVIIGFGLQDVPEHWLFEYEKVTAEPTAHQVNRINPYLVDALDILLENRTQPVCTVPSMMKGNQPTDGGELILSLEEKKVLLEKEPHVKKWLRIFLGADEFINGIERWCLWLVGIQPNELRAMPEVMQRVECVKQMRLASSKLQTREDASRAMLFQEIRQPNTDYLLIPSHSSENRTYIPVGYMSKNVVCSNANFLVPDATLYHFGIITSTMHMAWMRAVCGRLESRYRYSAGIVYNNFPWPEGSDKQAAAIATAAQAVLDARAQFPDATLADLYDPLTMPPALSKAHKALDKAVDVAYGKSSFKSEAERVAFLFERYQKLTSLLPGTPAKPRASKRKAKQAS